MLNNEKLVILSTLSDSIQAHLVLNKLKSESIECYLYDENIISINPFFDAAVGGIKVMVRAEDFDRAKEILNTDYSNDLNDNVVTE